MLSYNKTLLLIQNKEYVLFETLRTKVSHRLITQRYVLLKMVTHYLIIQR